jgi:hypothetical protein
MLRQFKMAITAALASTHETRSMMRARSLLQRFPVAQWMEDLEILQSNSIKLHDQKKLLAAKNTPLKAMKRKVVEVMTVAALLTTHVSNVISTQIRAISLALRPTKPRGSSEGQGQRRREILSERGRKASDAAEVAFAIDFRHLRSRLSVMDQVTEEQEDEETMASDFDGNGPMLSAMAEISETENKDDESFLAFTQHRQILPTADFTENTEGEEDENGEGIQPRTYGVEARDFAPDPVHLRHRCPDKTKIFEEDEEREEDIQIDSSMLSRENSAVLESTRARRKSTMAHESPLASQECGDSGYSAIPVTAISSWSSKPQANRGLFETASICREENEVSPAASLVQTPSLTAVSPFTTQIERSIPLAKRKSPNSENLQRWQKPPSAIPVWSGPFSPERTIYRPHEGAAEGWVDNYETSQVIFAIPPTPFHSNRHGSNIKIRHSGVSGQPRSQHQKSSVALYLTEKRLSLAAMVGGRRDFRLQNVEPFFTDSTVFYYGIFNELLDDLDARSSEDQLCIENFLIKSERQWFGRFHRAKLGQSTDVPEATSGSCDPNLRIDLQQPLEARIQEEFNLEEGFVAPTGLKMFFQRKLGDWQVYCVFLAFVRTRTIYFREAKLKICRGRSWQQIHTRLHFSQVREVNLPKSFTRS